MNDTEQLLARIEARLKHVKLSANAASEQAGLSRDLIRSIRRGVASRAQRSIETETLAKLAVVLKTSPQWLLSGAGPEEVDSSATSPSPPPVTVAAGRGDFEVLDGVHPPLPGNMPKDVPVLGTAMGSVFDNQEGFHFEGGAIDYLRRPPALANIRDLYAIYVVNDSMWPMHPAGEIRFVNPHKPPQAGSSVVVQTRAYDHDPGQAYIKLLRKRTPTKIVLEQFNPPLTIEIPLQFVRSMHHVYTTNELFGL